MIKSQLKDVVRGECQAVVHKHFRQRLPVEEVILEDVSVSPSCSAVLFRSGADVYLLITPDGRDSSTRMTLGDVRTVTRRMGLAVDVYFPPENDLGYFRREGIRAFHVAYPGLRRWSLADTTFYRSKATYMPALARLSGADGSVRAFSRASGTWVTTADLSSSTPTGGRHA